MDRRIKLLKDWVYLTLSHLLKKFHFEKSGRKLHDRWFIIHTKLYGKSPLWGGNDN